MQQNLSDLMNRIGYRFQDEALLKQAMFHSSYVNERKIRQTDSYERLEYLGDAVLELVTSDYLYHHFPEVEEGRLSKMRASMVSEHCLAQCAKDLHYPEYVYLGKGERQQGGANRESLLCDLFESVLGAIYLDGGMEPAREYVNRFLLSDITHRQLFQDAKTELQVLIQSACHHLPAYATVEESGSDHNKQFTVECYIGDICYGLGRGTSRKRAEQDAATKAIVKWKNEHEG